MQSKSLLGLFWPLALFQPGVASTVQAPLTIANVTLPDTLLIRTAQDFAKTTLMEDTYNHVESSWVFASILQRNLQASFAAVDEETLAVTVLLHDLGLDSSTFVPGSKRFEVDGAIVTRDWLEQSRQQHVIGSLQMVPF